MFSLKTAAAGAVTIGGESPVRIQSMYEDSLARADIDKLIERINTLSLMGMDILRFSFMSEEEAGPLEAVVSRSPVAIVADIHFDYRLAMLAMRKGAHKVRINPGNIGAEWKTREVVKCAKDLGRCIRIGLNSGSLPAKYRSLDAPSAMVASALDYIDVFESEGFENIVVSLKSSDGEETVEAARRLASLCPYPQHLGVTEAGDPVTSAVRSTWALGRLLSSGIGDTVRISMTGSMEEEVVAAVELLRCLGLRKQGVRIVSCPRCGRHTFDTIAFTSRVRPRLLSLGRDISLAIMGCPVNGPGEARSADYAITGAGGKVSIYVHGRLERVVDEAEAEKALFEVLDE